MGQVTIPQQHAHINTAYNSGGSEVILQSPPMIKKPRSIDSWLSSMH